MFPTPSHPGTSLALAHRDSPSPDAALTAQFNTALLQAKLRALHVMQLVMADQWPKPQLRDFCTLERYKLARLAATTVLRTPALKLPPGDPTSASPSSPPPLARSPQSPFPTPPPQQQPRSSSPSPSPSQSPEADTRPQPSHARSALRPPHTPDRQTRLASDVRPADAKHHQVQSPIAAASWRNRFDSSLPKIRPAGSQRMRGTLQVARPSGRAPVGISRTHTSPTVKLFALLSPTRGRSPP